MTTGSNDAKRIQAVIALRPEVFLHKPINLNDLFSGLGIIP